MQPSIQLLEGQALIRYGGMTVLVDPPEEGALPQADLVLLRGCGPAVRGWLLRQPLERAVVVLADAACADELRGRGVRRIQLLRLWSAYAMRKGRASLRLTVMPGAAAAQPPEPGSLGALLDLSDGGAAPCRIYVGGDAGEEDMRALPERFPGADLAIVRRGGLAVMLRFSPPMPRTRR
ncbi:hypothetical protein LJR289_004457 [Pseudoduganella sp. LjRoot289]|uniref:MBL fold metallo-hydrolase n=1 Tax=Pseudoduganella sp. LjRoot289 TaxID=3342314 RepID=UPI003ECCB884